MKKHVRPELAKKALGFKKPEKVKREDRACCGACGQTVTAGKGEGKTRVRARGSKVPYANVTPPKPIPAPPPAVSPEEFAKRYLPQYCRVPFSDMHREL